MSFVAAQLCHAVLVLEIEAADTAFSRCVSFVFIVHFFVCLCQELFSHQLEHLLVAQSLDLASLVLVLVPRDEEHVDEEL